MSPCLVVYYSFTGNTAKVAEEIAKRLAADVEVITELKPRKGMLGALRSVFEAVFDRLPIIKPAKYDAKKYDLVVLGFPVWAQKAATPMRTYALREKTKFKSIAGFCTEGGAGGEGALRKLSEQVEKTMVTQLVITEPDLKSDTWRAKVDDFVRSLPMSKTMTTESAL